MDSKLGADAMSIWKIALTVCGFVLLGIAAAVVLFPNLLPVAKIEENSVKIASGFRETGPVTGSAEPNAWIIDIEVSYPKRICAKSDSQRRGSGKSARNRRGVG